jgi:hypothetical protein
MPGIQPAIGLTRKVAANPACPAAGEAHNVSAK